MLGRVLCVAAAAYLAPLAGSTLMQVVGFSGGTSPGGIGDKLANPDKYAFSLTARMESNARAFALWQEHPLTGAGLGAFLERETARVGDDEEPLQVHNTALWLLTELGLFGFAAFAAAAIGVFAYCLKTWRTLRDRDPPAADWMLAAILVLLAWMTMSLAHEMLYQRIPWFVLGLCVGQSLLARVRL